MKLCFECDSPAEEEHHPIPQSLGGTRTISVCSPCHGRAHQVNRGSIPELTKLGLQRRKEAGVRLGAPVNLLPETLARIVSMRAEGMTMQKIADTLASEGISTSKGARWWPSTIQAALKTHRLNQETEAILASLK